jgi:DNA-binding response OmpR family regulator
MRVLVVEDDPALFEVIRDYLQLSGYQVSGARDEQECIAALAGETFDPVHFLFSDLT